MCECMKKKERKKERDKKKGTEHQGRPGNPLKRESTNPPISAERRLKRVRTANHSYAENTREIRLSFSIQRSIERPITTTTTTTTKESLTRNAVHNPFGHPKSIRCGRSFQESYWTERWGWPWRCCIRDDRLPIQRHGFQFVRRGPTRLLVGPCRGAEIDLPCHQSECPSRITFRLLGQ